MLVISAALHIIGLGALVAFDLLDSTPASAFGYQVYQVDLITLPVSASKPMRALNEPYKVVTRKEAAAPEEKAGLAINRTPKLVSEKPDAIGPDTPPSFASGTPGVRLDVEEFPFPYYLAAIQRKIQQHFVVPRMPGVGRLQSIVYFRIAKDGRIYDITIEQDSSNPTFDLATQRALQAATPLPPLPGEYEEKDLGVHFEFLYNP
jgi:outer membrane biosynthesis protein TonB